MPFPADFAWGVATSAYQVEGSPHADGRGESIWDRFCRQPGAVAGGATGDVACDHYRRWEKDLDLLAELGVRTYRFSLAWPRLFPDGDDRLNQAGLDHYRRLVDGLLARGITPAVTLHHWDVPARLQDDHGGWEGRETALRFADYAAAAFNALGDRVPLWITMNEPWVVAILGFFRGVHAPGHTDFAEALLASHHQLLGHGLAVQAFRASGATGQIGITLNLQPTYPLADSEADRAAARLSHGYTDRWYLDPVFGRGYPADLAEVYARHGFSVDFDSPDDQATIATPMDFLGVNYYSRRVVSAGGDEFGWKVREGPSAGIETTGMAWEVVPDAMADLFAALRRDYPPLPIYVTENGASYADEPGPDGTIQDPARIAFLERHFAVAEQAIADGTDLRGYFVWSFMDNLEWALGYGPRFGLVHVDYATQRRTPKASFSWYRDLIARNAL